MIGVYGANGFVGRHLVRWLASREMLVRAVSRRLDGAFVHEFDDAVEFVEADLGHPLDMASSLQGVHTVVQLISTSSPGTKNDYTIADIEDNILPHVSFLQSCVRFGVERYIFLSSGGIVYGPQAPTPTPETCTANPINSYGLTKLIVEKYIQMYGYVDGLEYVILRVANLFGPGQEFRKGQGILPMLIDSWKKKRKVTILGDGGARRDYVFIDDAVDAIGASLNLEGRPQTILNIGSGETQTVNEVVEAVEKAAGYRFEREYVASRNTDVEVSHLDISLAREILDWAPKTEFHVGVEAVVGSG